MHCTRFARPLLATALLLGSALAQALTLAPYSAQALAKAPAVEWPKPARRDPDSPPPRDSTPAGFVPTSI